LASLKDLADEEGFDLHGAHLDHCLDPESGRRARRASEIASSLGVPLVLETTEVLGQLQRGEGVEAGARRLRYAFLERVRHRIDARFIATAHHRDDQAETLLQRLASGSGMDGLAGILPIHGSIVRPLLTATRRQIEGELLERNLAPVEDPTNTDLKYQRNRMRHRVLPSFATREPDLPQRLAALAETARRVRYKLDRRMIAKLDLRREPGGEASASLSCTRALPKELLGPALSALCRASTADYPIPQGARHELHRQLRSEHPPGLDCGSGWRLEGQGDRLWLYAVEPPTPFFSYTFRVPGTLEIPEIGARLRMRPGREGVPSPSGGDRGFFAAHQACLQLPLGSGDVVTVRNRRPGDRVQVSESRSGRRLKEILIDSKVPRRHRDRLPLLCIGGAIAWVPGVAVAKGLVLDRADLANEIALDDGIAQEDSGRGDRSLISWNAEITGS